MTADDLKITVLRAAKPGDFVFFNVGSDDNAHRELMIALANYLRPTGIIPVMLPPSIQLVGSIFEKAEAFPQLKLCKYVENPSLNVRWHTACGQECFFLDLPKFCMYCGGQVEQAATPGAAFTGEDSGSKWTESSRPRELLDSKETLHTDLAPALKEAIGKIELQKAEILKLRDELRNARLETARACMDALQAIGTMAGVSQPSTTPLTDAAMRDGFTGCDMAVPVEFSQRLERENHALRNLAANLRPGPISEALGGVEYERSYREAVEVTLNVPFGICPKCKQPITSFHNLSGCLAEKTQNILGIPILIVEDPKIPPTEIELRSPNGQVVRLVNLEIPREIS